jgi:transcriptional regulator with XRE-family HTH domain
MQRLSGSELRSRRLRAGLSRERLAHEVGVPITAVTEWEEEVAPIACPRAVEQVLRQREEAESERLPHAS